MTEAITFFLFVNILSWVLFFLLCFLMHLKNHGPFQLGKFHTTWVKPELPLPRFMFIKGDLVTTIKLGPVSMSIIRWKHKKATWKNQDPLDE